MAETAEEVLTDLAAYIGTTSAATGTALAGLRELGKWARDLEVSPGNPDPRLYFGEGDPNTPEARAYGAWRLSEVIKETQPGGALDARLTQQWVVALFTAWEHEFRPRLAKAHGCDPDELLYDIWGDLRLIRNDIVHHHGIAQAKNTGRCRALRWYQPGDVVLLRARHFAELDGLYPWSQMGQPPHGT
jgi:hypothetical protein